MITIRPISNGFLIQRDAFSDPQEFAFQEREEFDICEKRHIIEMLYQVLSELGVCGSKHDEHRVEITCKCKEGIE